MYVTPLHPFVVGILNRYVLGIFRFFFVIFVSTHYLVLFPSTGRFLALIFPIVDG